MAVNPNAYLLRLPKDIIARILRETGLIRNYPIVLQPFRNGVQESYNRLLPGYLSRRPLPYEPFPAALFLICSKLHGEVLKIFYGENIFDIDYDVYYTTSKQCQFSPRMWANIRILTVRCGSGTRPAERTSGANSLMALKFLCEKLSQGLRPGHTIITFVLCAETVTVAQVLLAQIANLPTLASIRIRVYGIGLKESLTTIARDWKTGREVRKGEIIRNIFKEVAQRLTHTPVSQFPFLRLPLDLQLMILSYAGLIANPTKREGVSISRSLSLLNDCCGNCGVHGREYRFDNEFDCWCNTNILYFSNCTCNSHIESGLFATSKYIREEALKIAYSRNDFLIQSFSGTVIAWTIKRLSLVPSSRLRWVTRLTIELGGLQLRNETTQLIELLRLIHKSCAQPHLFLKLKLAYCLADQAAEIKELYGAMSRLGFDKRAILLLNPPRLAYGSRADNFIAVLGQGKEHDLDEVVAMSETTSNLRRVISLGDQARVIKTLLAVGNAS